MIPGSQGLAKGISAEGVGICVAHPGKPQWSPTAGHSMLTIGPLSQLSHDGGEITAAPNRHAPSYIIPWSSNRCTHCRFAGGQPNASCAIKRRPRLAYQASASRRSGGRLYVLYRTAAPESSSAQPSLVRSSLPRPICCHAGRNTIVSGYERCL